MSTISRFLVTIGTASGLLLAQDLQNRELARRLANDATQRAAVEQVVALGDKKVPLLLSWAKNPPVDLGGGFGELDLYSFRGGLADIFGQLKVKDAIPFLIQNISLHRWPSAGVVWMKAPTVIEDRMPAINALIRIGPDALDALLNEPDGPLSSEDRLARLFVVAKIAFTVEHNERAREYLNSVLGEVNTERFWAQEGIEWLDMSAKTRRP